MEKSDILIPSDITKLIKTFYDKLLISDIKHHFISLDLEIHLPHVDAFWNAVVFPEFSYAKNLIEKHRHLSLEKGDFNIWLRLFRESVDELYSGTNAQVLKDRASGVSYIMKTKLIKD